MKLTVRAHDTGANSVSGLLDRLEELGVDGAQLVCYKILEDIPYVPGAITAEKAAAIGKAFAQRGKEVSLVGAYFNPMSIDDAYVRSAMDIFSDYLHHCKALGCNVVGSETGVYTGECENRTLYNRRPDSFQKVVGIFSQLSEVAQSCGSVLGLEAASTHTCYDVKTLQKARKIIGGKSRVIVDLVNLMDADNQYNYMDVLKEALDEFGDDILLFHLKDCKRENGKHPRIVPVGTGEMDYAEILGTIKKWNPGAVLTLEETPNAYLDAAVKMIRETWERV